MWNVTIKCDDTYETDGLAVQIFNALQAQIKRIFKNLYKKNIKAGTKIKLKYPLMKQLVYFLHEVPTLLIGALCYIIKEQNHVI